VLHHRHIDDDPSVHGLWTDEITGDQIAAAVPVPLAAGGATFHHPRTLHHTGPNSTDRPRRAYANEFQTTPVLRETPMDRPWVDEGQVRWNERPVVIAGGTPGTP
jgi:ectoine hydroxylase-related dioxygenase (phytanoyl-CoA dioxygenase family)